MFKKIPLLILILIFQVYSEFENNDGNRSKLFTIGETGTICDKRNGFGKFGFNVIIPTLQTAYAPFKNWEFDVFWAGMPTIKNQEEKSEFGFRVLRLGFKHHILSKKRFLFIDTYDMSWGLKLHLFRFLIKEADTVKVDKHSPSLIPFLAQSLSKGRFAYHLYFSLPLGEIESEAVGVDADDSPTFVFVSGFEYSFKYVKLILEYWYTNLGGFIDVHQEGRIDFLGYNQSKQWISYMFIGARLSFFKRFIDHE